MNKILIIIQREFLNRVSKKSFILLTILMPFIFAALIFVPALLSTVKSDEVKQVVIIDHTQKYIGQFKDDESYHFIAGQEMLPEYRSDTTRIDAVVEITEDLIQNPTAAAIYSRKEVTKGLLSLVNNTLNEQIRHDKLTSYNIPELQNIMQDFDKRYSARTIKWSEDGSANESNAGIAVAVGMILTFLIYMFVMSYGGMVMQSVMEEKTSRIVELMVSSVKPLQLMLGKIIGILLVVLLGIADNTFGGDAAILKGAEGMISALQNLNLLKLGTLFTLNFIGGFLIYASIFAAIGASINAMEDSQQFMTPIMILMVFSLYAGIYSGDNPDGPLAFWCSHPIYLAYRHDGTCSAGCTDLANYSFALPALCLSTCTHLDFRKNISCRYPDVWQKADTKRDD